MSIMNRREFLAATSAACGSALCGCTTMPAPTADKVEPVIDIHQHTNYHGRTDEELIAHQRTMGVSHTVLLPAGKYFGLEVGAGGNDTVVHLAHQLPRQ